MERDKELRDGGQVSTSYSTFETEGESPTPLSFKNSLSLNQEQPGVEGKSASVLDPELLLDKSNRDKTKDAFFILNTTANLDPIVKIFSEKKQCELKYLVVECECGRSVVPSGCMSLACTRCANAVGSRRSRRIYDKLMVHLHHDAVIYTVFTIPIERRASLTDKKKWGKLRKKAWDILKGFGGRFGVEASHPISEENPTQFHPHLNFLWRQRKGFRPFINVEALRIAWAKELKVAEINVNTRYSREAGSIKHMCNYVARTFPGLHKWAGSIKWFGKYPKSGKEKKEKSFCGDCGEELKAVGTIYGWLVKDWYSQGFTGERAPPWDDSKNVTLFKRKGKSHEKSKGMRIQKL